MTSFSDLGLAETILRALAAEGYERPTPIQAEVVPHMLAGKDVLGIAQTGTGKTAAFVLPLLQALAVRPPKREPRSCGALIVTPTRELATQIADEIARYGRHMRLAVATILGGVKPGPQVRALSRGVDIVVATPGRLLDHQASGAISLNRVTTLVLDEADQMLDLGFLPAIRRIVAKLPQDRQTVMMSATMPAEIRKLATQLQNAPEEVSVAPVSRPIEEIEQRVLAVEADQKRDRLAEILAEPDVSRAIVFARTKHGADKLQRHLERVGLSASALHGNKSQNQRERALDAFRSGASPILVATDIAARGVHVDDVSHVINYELPEVAEVYVHRIGRTARAGRSGVAISLCSREERKLLRAIERLTGTVLLGDRPAREEPHAGRSGQARNHEGERRQAPSKAGGRPPKRSSGPGRRGRRPNRPNSAEGPGPAGEGRRRQPRAQAETGAS